MDARTHAAADTVERLRKMRNGALDTLGGIVQAFDPETGTVTMDYLATAQMCHSEVIVQGGFITGMLDATIAYAGFAAYEHPVRMASLDINVSFLGVGNAGPMRGCARPVRLGRTIGFLNAELFQNDVCIATATSTVRLVFPK